MKMTSKRSSLLLIETLIAIMFFSVISAACLSVFVMSHKLSRNASMVNMAITQTDSVIALLQHDLPAQAPEAVGEIQDYLYTSLSAIYTEAEIDSSADKPQVLIYYDNDYQTCPVEQADSCLLVTASPDYRGGLICQLTFKYMKDTGSFYEIQTLLYKSRGEEAQYE